MGILDDKLKGIPYAGMNAGNNNYKLQADLQKIKDGSVFNLPYAGMNAGNNNYNPQADLQKISNGSIFNLPYAGMNAGNNNYNPQADLQKISNGSIFSNGTSTLLNSLSNGINNIGNGISNAINTYYDNIQPQSNTVNTQQTQLNPIVNQQQGVKTDGSYVTDTPYTRNPNVNYQGTQTSTPVIQQPVNNVTQPSTPVAQQPVVNNNIPNNTQQQSSIRNIVNQPLYRNVGNVETIFSQRAGNSSNNNQPQNNYNTNNGSLFDSYKFNQDNYNQELRNNANQGYNDSRGNFLNIANNIKNASIADMMQMSIIGNQYRQDMRKNQADFTNANNLASRNLEQQNQIGLTDLMNQRSSSFEDKKLNNDDSRLRIEQERLNQQQLQNNIESNYKQDYLNKYLMPQLNQQKANQDAQLQLQRDINSGTINQNKARENYFNTLDQVQILQNAIKDDALKNINLNNLPKDADINSIKNTVINNALLNNPVYQELQGQLARNMVQSGLQPNVNDNTVTLKTIKDENGNVIGSEETSKKSIASKK